VAELVQDDAGEQGKDEGDPESAAALPPASQYVTPTQAMSRKNVACT